MAAHEKLPVERIFFLQAGAVLITDFLKNPEEISRTDFGSCADINGPTNINCKE